MGIDRTNSANPSDRIAAFKKAQASVQRPTANPDSSETKPVAKSNLNLNFPLVSNADKEQIANSREASANTRGADDLQIETNSAWASKGVKEPSLKNLDDATTTVLAKLESISKDAYRESETAQLFNLGQEGKDLDT